jgi:hypothetical protein
LRGIIGAKPSANAAVAQSLPSRPLTSASSKLRPNSLNFSRIAASVYGLPAALSSIL